MLVLVTRMQGFLSIGPQAPHRQSMVIARGLRAPYKDPMAGASEKLLCRARGQVPVNRSFRF